MQYLLSIYVRLQVVWRINTVRCSGVTWQSSLRLPYILLISRTFLPGMWPVFCLRLIRATYPKGQSFLSAIALTEQKMIFSGQMFAMTPMTQMKMTPTTIYRTYRRTSFFRRRRFLRFWTIKLTFITFTCKNQDFVVDWSRRIFTGEKVNWPAAYSWISLDSRYMAKISAAAYLRMRLISDYIRYLFSCKLVSLLCMLLYQPLLTY